MTSNQSSDVSTCFPILRDLLLDRIAYLEHLHIPVQQDPKIGRYLLMAQEFLSKNEQEALFAMLLPSVSASQRQIAIGVFLLCVNREVNR